MESNVSYNDFKGTVSADIADKIAEVGGTDDLKYIGKYFKLDETKYKLIGLSIYGLKSPSISLICVDIAQSTLNKEYIVSMLIDNIVDENILELLFKRIEILLFNQNDNKYPKIEINDEVRFSEVH